MRILIAEDDEALAKFVRQGLETEHYSVDVMADGEQARTAAIETEYDVVVLDLSLPKMDGVTVLRHLRSKKPTVPVLILTQRTRVEDRVQCLDTGADDYVPKQLSSSSLEIAHIRSDLVDKIRAAAIAHRSRSQQVDLRRQPARVTLENHYSVSAVPAVVALGTSTGGPRALQQILPRFPRDLSVPILIVQHMPLGFTGPFALRLKGMCAIDVREAKDGEPVGPGVAYIAPAGRHMRVERRSIESRPVISLKTDSTGELHIPSVDVLMSSVAEVYRGRAIGVIMTGMGCDGAQGMQAIHREGGFTIGQDETTCTVYGMPRACADLGVLDCVLPLDRIPAEILQATRRRRLA